MLPVGEEFDSSGRVCCISNKLMMRWKLRRLCDCGTVEDATLSRHSGIDIKQLSLQNRLSTNHSGEVSKADDFIKLP